LQNQSTNNQKIHKIDLNKINSQLTPTPKLFMDTTVNAPKRVVMTPTTNAAGMIAKLILFKK
jgi:hypothetical protein